MTDKQFELAKSFANAVTVVEYQKELSKSDKTTNPHLAAEIYQSAYEYGLKTFKDAD